MCGIAGIVRPGGVTRDELARITSTLSHRGPDGDGFLLSGDAGLGHRRLAVIDLAGGAQPMSSADGRFHLVANAEIYNHRELRAKLERAGHAFRTHCDVEVLLHGWREWGRGLTDLVRGMFAFAIWDALERRLVLARDPFGEKPLYFSQIGDTFAFASEAKALLSLAKERPSIEPEALSRYLVFDFIPAPWSIYRGVRKLGAGELLIRDDTGTARERFWQPPRAAPATTTFEVASRELRTRVEAAVRSQLMSDVPLGVLLSGGLDSTILATIAARSRQERLRTFSIGFDDPAYDESASAREVAARLGTEHFERRFSADELHRVVPEIVANLDEPLADAALLPTHLLARLAREHVTVALGGDGADELFAGYDSFLADRIDAAIPLKSLAKKALSVAAAVWPASEDHFGTDLRLRQFSRALELDESVRGIGWMATFLPRELPSISRLAAGDPLAEARLSSDLRDPVERSQQQLQRLYLEGDILTKIDRASMSCGLELRSPFLDRDVADFASSLPIRYKMRGFERKRILRHAFADDLGASARRRKHGFWVPIARWINGPLAKWFDEVLLDEANFRDGLLERDAVEKLLRAHRERRANLRKPLWNLTMLALWRARWLS